jgi:hypothetical protein
LGSRGIHPDPRKTTVPCRNRNPGRQKCG